MQHNGRLHTHRCALFITAFVCLNCILFLKSKSPHLKYYYCSWDRCDPNLTEEPVMNTEY